MDGLDFILHRIDSLQYDNNVEINYSYVLGLLTIADNKFGNKYEDKLISILNEDYKIRLVNCYFPF